MKKPSVCLIVNKDKNHEFWKTVWFTNKSKFNISVRDGKAKVEWKVGKALTPESLVSTVKHSGTSVIVWDSKTAAGRRNLAFVFCWSNHESQTIFEHI